MRLLLMAELRVVKFDDNLMAQLKSKAALAGTTLRLYVMDALRAYIKAGGKK
jgi:hypothetical protein